MLKLFFLLKEMHFGKLMEVYTEGNAENAVDRYPQDEHFVGMLKVEQDFYQYLKTDFFCADGAFYAVWEENGAYISALRMEPYKDGLLLEALETHPTYRQQGYAKKLVSAVLDFLSSGEYQRVYSHVHKRNIPSLKTHMTCGFQKISEQATYIDGSVTQKLCTLVYVFKA